MKLYRQVVSRELGEMDPELIMEHDSIEHLKNTARQIAISLGCLDISWTDGVDSGASFQFPIELEVNETLRLIIRQW